MIVELSAIINIIKKTQKHVFSYGEMVDPFGWVQAGRLSGWLARSAR